MEGSRRRRARQIIREMESIGGSLGGQAHEDYCDFGFVLPSRYLSRGFDILADVLRNPAFRDDDIRKEKNLTLADLKSRKDAIFQTAYDALLAKLFPGHPYGWPMEGRPERVARFTARDLRRWHGRFFRPDRMSLAVTSPWPFARVRREVQRFFGDWARVGSGPIVSMAAPAHPRPARLRLKTRFEQAYLMTGYRAPGLGDPDYLPLKLFNIALGGGMSSRLFIGLREKHGLAYEVASFYTTRRGAGSWVVYMGLPRERLAEAKRRLDELLRQAMQNGLTRAELAQAKALMRGSFLMENQPRRRQAWYAAWWVWQGRDPNHGPLFLREMEAVTLTQVNLAARRLLGGTRVVVEAVPR
jgi:predicted Zn-dependent peptidase